MSRITFTLTLLLLFSLTVTSQTFNKARMDSFFRVLSDNNRAMGSVAFAKNGKIVYTNAIGYASVDGNNKIPATVNTKYRIGSITKMFTGVIIFQLIEEKKLTLETTIDKFFPSVPNATKINIGHLLSHRS